MPVPSIAIFKRKLRKRKLKNSVLKSLIELSFSSFTPENSGCRAASKFWLEPPVENKLIGAKKSERAEGVRPVLCSCCWRIHHFPQQLSEMGERMMNRARPRSY